MFLEIRLVNDGNGNLQLQQRSRLPQVDHTGAFCGVDAWSDWTAVPIVHGDDCVVSTIDIFDTRGLQ